MQVNDLTKTGSYTWKCHNAGNWSFNSYESSVLTKQAEDAQWKFQSMNHLSYSPMLGFITSGLKATLYPGSNNFNLDEEWAIEHADYSVTVCPSDIGSSCISSESYHSSATFKATMDRKPFFSEPSIQTY